MSADIHSVVATSAGSKTLTTCPMEILDLIATAAPLDDALSLCTVSKLLCAVSTRRIYKRAVLSSGSASVRFCRTILSSGSAAHALRACVFTPQQVIVTVTDGVITDDILPCFYRLMVAALKRAVNLTSLNLSLNVTSESVAAYIFDSLSLPNLQSLFSTIPVFECLGRFFARHPLIHRLDVATVINTMPDFSGPAFANRLPHLKRFAGPAPLARAFLPGSPVQDVSLHWSLFGDKNYDETISALTKCTAPSGIVNLSVMVVAWSLNLALAIARHLPALRALTFAKLLPAGTELPHLPHLLGAMGDPLDTFLPGIIKTLPAFPDLRILAITPALILPVEAETLDTDFMTLAEILDSSPHLVNCILPTGTSWIRTTDTSKAWFPSHTGALLWIVKMATTSDRALAADFIEFLDGLLQGARTGPGTLAQYDMLRKAARVGRERLQVLEEDEEERLRGGVVDEGGGEGGGGG